MGKGIHQRRTKVREHVSELITKGLTTKEIMDQTGCCPSLVSQIRRAIGATTPQQLNVKTVVDVVADLMTTTWTMLKIAQARNVCEGTVKKINKCMNERELMMPRRKGRTTSVTTYAQELGLTDDQFIAGMVKAYKAYKKDEPMLPYKAIAERYHVSRSSLHSWERQGLLDVYYTAGGHRRYRVSDVENVTRKKPESIPLL